MMRLGLVTCLLLVTSASAGVGHDSPEDTFLTVHWTEAGAAMNPSAATSWSLPAPWTSDACTPTTHRVPFTQVDPDGGLQDVPMLAREVATAAAPARLAWYLEQTDADGEPLDLPWPSMAITARLESGADVLAAGSATGTPVPLDGERTVGRMDVDLSWQHDGVLPQDGLVLVVETGMDGPCDGLPHIRPYGDAEAASVLRFAIYEPILIDRIDPILGDEVRFVVHASSPWGREDIVSLQPTATLQSGPAPLRAVPTVVETGLAQAYAIDAVVNGTVRVDVVATNTAGSSDERSLVFQVGGPAPAAPAPTPSQPPAPQGKDAPLPLAWAILGLVLAARRLG